jgi:hypothetical protein
MGDRYSLADLLVVTLKRVDGVKERGGASANKDMHDCGCVDVSALGGHFFHVPKDWEVKLGAVNWRCVFSIFQKIIGLGEYLETP